MEYFLKFSMTQKKCTSRGGEIRQMHVIKVSFKTFFNFQVRGCEFVIEINTPGINGIFDSSFDFTVLSKIKSKL